MSTPQVFIVDDDPVALLILKKVLAKCDVFPAPLSFVNGKQMLEHLQKSFSVTGRYVIFLDINMPVMNGWEFLEAASAFANRDTITVYLVTSSTDETDHNKAQSYPLVAKFLSKPITLDMLNDLQ